MVVVDAGAETIGRDAGRMAVGDGQAGDGDGPTGADVKHAVDGGGVIAVDGEVGRAGAEDGDAVGDQQLAIGQCDHAGDAGAKHNDLPVDGVGQSGTQRAVATVIGVEHDKRGRRQALFQCLALWPVARPTPCPRAEPSATSVPMVLHETA